VHVCGAKQYGLKAPGVSSGYRPFGHQPPATLPCKERRLARRPSPDTHGRGRPHRPAVPDEVVPSTGLDRRQGLSQQVQPLGDLSRVPHRLGEQDQAERPRQRLPCGQDGRPAQRGLAMLG
jgi:hypothetical protein